MKMMPPILCNQSDRQGSCSLWGEVRGMSKEWAIFMYSSLFRRSSSDLLFLASTSLSSRSSSAETPARRSCSAFTLSNLSCTSRCAFVFILRADSSTKEKCVPPLWSTHEPSPFIQCRFFNNSFKPDWSSSFARSARSSMNRFSEMTPPLGVQNPLEWTSCTFMALSATVAMSKKVTISSVTRADEKEWIEKGLLRKGLNVASCY